MYRNFEQNVYVKVERGNGAHKTLYIYSIEYKYTICGNGMYEQY